MQLPVLGDFISVKNLKECLSKLDDDVYLTATDWRNLAVCKLKYFPNGRYRDIECEYIIDFYLEEIIDYDTYKEMKEEDKWSN